MKFRLPLLALLSATLLCPLASCSSEGPQRKKVVGPDSGDYSSLPWNRPRPWEGNARYGAFVPGSR